MELRQVLSEPRRHTYRALSADHRPAGHGEGRAEAAVTARKHGVGAAECVGRPGGDMRYGRISLKIGVHLLPAT